MTRTPLAAFVAAPLALAALVAAPRATHAVLVTVNVLSNNFSPATVNIQQGDTVRWVKTTSAFHNVRADDDSFTSGSATDDAFTLEHTFTSVGAFGYQCDVHAPSMVGVVNVGQADEPGFLSFQGAAAVSVGEAAGQVTLTLTRTAGDDGAVSVEVDSADGTASAGLDYTALATTVNWADNDDDNRTVSIPILEDTSDEPSETFTVTLSQPGGGASLGATTTVTVTVVDNDEPIAACVPDATTLCLNHDRFQVRATWIRPDGPTGDGQAKDIALDDTGLFTFFNPNNVELLVKVLNGCTVPGLSNYWVFIASATSVEWHVTVVDTQEGISKTYDKAQGTLAPLLADTAAFATCP